MPYSKYLNIFPSLVEKIRNYCYVPYSNFPVVVSILLSKSNLENNSDGNKDEFIFGVNIENIALGETICAEKAALSQVYSLGKSKLIKAIFIFSVTERYLTPCGSCRQVLVELVPKNVTVILVNRAFLFKKIKVKNLLPDSFDNRKFKLMKDKK